MKKYAAYIWTSDDEGGMGICPASEFTPNTGYHPESGWRARPSVKIGEFDTAEELAEILIIDDPQWYEGRKSLALAHATQMIESYEDCDDYIW